VEEGKQTGTLMHRHASLLDTAGTPAIAKKVHREDPDILGCQPHMAMAAACCHFPKMDERKNKHM
jgi:hypothetical protein